MPPTVYQCLVEFCRKVLHLLLNIVILYINTFSNIVYYYCHYFSDVMDITLILCRRTRMNFSKTLTIYSFDYFIMYLKFELGINCRQYYRSFEKTKSNYVLSNSFYTTHIFAQQIASDFAQLFLIGI